MQHCKNQDPEHLAKSASLACGLKSLDSKLDICSRALFLIVDIKNTGIEVETSKTDLMLRTVDTFMEFTCGGAY